MPPKFPTLTVCPGRDLGMGTTAGWGFAEALLNALDPADPENRRLFEFIPRNLAARRAKLNRELLNEG